MYFTGTLQKMQQIEILGCGKGGGGVKGDPFLTEPSYVCLFVTAGLFDPDFHEIGL